MIKESFIIIGGFIIGKLMYEYRVLLEELKYIKNQFRRYRKEMNRELKSMDITVNPDIYGSDGEDSDNSWVSFAD